MTAVVNRDSDASSSGPPVELPSDRRPLLYCAWSGVAASALILIGLVGIAKFIPTQPASETAQQVVAYYAHNLIRIEIGMFVAMIGCTLFIPFGVAIALQTRRIERRPVLTYIQVACVAIASVLGVMCMVIWGTAAFRAGTISPEITQLMHDFGWFAFLFDVTPFTLWLWAIGVAIVRDPRPTPIFPRWLGWLNFWIGSMFLPAELMAVFKTGPFAYDGLLALYIPAGLFFAWLVMMTPFVVRAVKAEPGI
ncbi:hypothetical protein MycrhDRAFT_1596 [Mycolicibacterium rhodesiae JS60]|nr:hypothetical protein MycrhDRAFT_1596 [Mycolicibacterium rhodesiae JS60]